MNSMPTFLQIVELIKDKILLEEYLEGERIPSVREMAEMIQVNVNTVARAFDRLQMSDIIYSQRGIGYFVQKDAKNRIAKELSDRFIEQTLPEVFRKMDLLKIEIQQVIQLYENRKKEDS